MTQKELNDWFNNLDSTQLEFLFSSLYEEAMTSADPSVNINTFYKEVKKEWKQMTKEQKEEMYKEAKEI